MVKEVHVIFSDGDRHIYKEGYTKASEEFLKQSDINNHVIVTPKYFKEIERKAEAYERIEQAYFDNDNYSDEQFMELIEETIEEVESGLERGSDVEV